jgi:hypothetical protein
MIYRWRRRECQVGSATTVGDCQIDNLPPSILLTNFWLHGYMRRHMNTRDILRLEGRSLWSGLNYPFPNTIEEPSLKQVVQLLGVSIKMN